jgi:hypothetical protein
VIDDYLSCLGERLRVGAAERARILEEVREHLLEASAVEIARGASAEDAASQAIARFGQPGAVARAFGRRRDWLAPLRRLSNVVRRRAAMTGTTSDAYRCSFCGKGREQVRRLIAGPNFVYICSECVALCNEIIDREEGRPEPSPA